MAREGARRGSASPGRHRQRLPAPSEPQLPLTLSTRWVWLWGLTRLQKGSKAPDTEGRGGREAAGSPANRSTVCNPIHTHCLALLYQTRSIHGPSLVPFQPVPTGPALFVGKNGLPGGGMFPRRRVRRSVWTAGHVRREARPWHVKAGRSFEGLCCRAQFRS